MTDNGNKTEKIASKFLGKKISGSDFYNPDFLVAIPRYENRKQYNIDNNALPFEGWDVWHAYEFSAMTKNGLPITRVVKLKYSSSSEFIVESKSLKLYLNSFNMTRNGMDISECLEICKRTIKKDLENKLDTDVEVSFINNDSPKQEIFQNFKNLLNYVDEKKLCIENFKENPELLLVENTNKYKKYFYTFDSLRSNCRVTHQPDFGDIFIFYGSKKHIKEDSLVQYLCSFRSEYHFHEECCEMIYKRLYDLLDRNDELFVCALYTRRGGIDICPARWNSPVEDVYKLIDTNIFARNGIKQ